MSRLARWSLSILILLMLSPIIRRVLLVSADRDARNNPVFSAAVARLQKSLWVQQAVGSNLHVVGLVSLNENTTGDTGVCTMDIPIAGSKSGGMLSLRAIKVSGEWELQEESFQVAGGKWRDVEQ